MGIRVSSVWGGTLFNCSDSRTRDRGGNYYSGNRISYVVSYPVHRPEGGSRGWVGKREGFITVDSKILRFRRRTSPDFPAGILEFPIRCTRILIFSPTCPWLPPSGRPESPQIKKCDTPKQKISHSLSSTPYPAPRPFPPNQNS